MGFYDTPDYDYNAAAAREAAAREAEQRAAQAADQRFNNEMYGDSSYSSNDWHIDAICVRLGFTDKEANIIKSQYDRVFQGLFGGAPLENTPQQYESERTPMRDGDPNGLLGFMFSIVRKVYFSLETVPVVNDLRFWAAIDQMVLSQCSHPTVERYLTAIQVGLSVKTAH
ncbi:hypothetical protein ACSYAD_29150 [Acaryochloris marina NIES-2412]|uniref:hypothetical protein n=1 Tax=Acaryochloris marina TaxID=155978 RepID=UPI004059127F